MNQVRSPTLARRMLLTGIRRMHDHSGKTLEEVASFLGMDTSTAWRWVNGQKQFKPADIIGLCAAYGVDQATQDQLVKLAHEARSNRRGLVQRLPWFTRYQFDVFLTLEQDASAIDTFESTLVPGLLQTAGYAEAIIQEEVPGASEDDVAERLRVRLARQEILRRPQYPVRLTALLDEAVLHRVVRDAPTMREQLDHLIEVCRRPTCTVRVIPFAAGAHPAGSIGPFVVFRFDDVATIAYQESATHSRYQETEEELDRYNSLLDRLTKRALPPEESVALIAAARDGL